MPVRGGPLELPVGSRAAAYSTHSCPPNSGQEGSDCLLFHLSMNTMGKFSLMLLVLMGLSHLLG